jgi:hypothetical protein
MYKYRVKQEAGSDPGCSVIVEEFMQCHASGYAQLMPGKHPDGDDGCINRILYGVSACSLWRVFQR